MDIQIKKGLIDTCVLAVLNKGDSYGYQIAKDISSVMVLSETTLYPVLKRLMAAEYIKSYEVVHNGRLRKYFSIQLGGKEKLKGFESEQKALLAVYDFIFKSIHADSAHNKEVLPS